MSRGSNNRSAFALYEVLIGLTIFVVGVLTLGRAVENCMHASTLSTQEDRIRQILANRMAEIQATPGFPDAKKEFNVNTAYGEVKLTQKSAAAGLRDEKDREIANINRVSLEAEWTRGGVKQSRSIEFYVYRPG